jgi:hypothetical protein
LPEDALLDMMVAGAMANEEHHGDMPGAMPAQELMFAVREVEERGHADVPVQVAGIADGAREAIVVSEDEDDDDSDEEEVAVSSSRPVLSKLLIKCWTGSHSRSA